jgi:phospholipid/cholesterol/gamma-HCH transport system substrate-binding protein
VVSPKAVGAGAFVILGALLFAGVLFKIGERRMLFERHFTVYTEFSRLALLEPGAVVRVAGLSAGQITGIQVPNSPGHKFRVKMEVRDDLRPLIRSDSVATPQTEGLLGGVFINIAAGTARAPEVPDGGTIPGREPFVLADLLHQASDTMTLVNDTVSRVNDTVARISDDMESAVEQVAVTTEDAHELLIQISPSIRAIAENGSRISGDAQQMVAKLRNGEGTIGRLINDDTLYNRASHMVDEAGRVMVNVREATDETRRVLADLRSLDGPAQGLMGEMRATLGHAREATADLADNMEALKHNFLLKGFFNRRGYFDLDAISPAEYRSGVLERDKRKAMRIWLSSAVLFERRPDGTEGLTADGRARLDSAMATFIRYLPSHPLVVEGYAVDGSKADSFRVSRLRAGLVREYLRDRYDLMPQHTGFIGLGDETQGSPDGNRWDGVALTLFLNTEGVEFASQEYRAGIGQTTGSGSTR